MGSQPSGRAPDLSCRGSGFDSRSSHMFTLMYLYAHSSFLRLTLYYTSRVFIIVIYIVDKGARYCEVLLLRLPHPSHRNKYCLKIINAFCQSPYSVQTGGKYSSAC